MPQTGLLGGQTAREPVFHVPPKSPKQLPCLSIAAALAAGYVLVVRYLVKAAVAHCVRFGGGGETINLAVAVAKLSTFQLIFDLLLCCCELITSGRESFDLFLSLTFGPLLR